MFALDNLDYISRFSGYRDASYKLIHCLDLAFPNAFFSYLSGRAKFHRGIIITATTRDIPPNPALELTLQHQPIPPYGKQYDRRIESAIGTAPTVLQLEGLTKEQTKELLLYYRKSKVWDDGWGKSLP